MIVGVSESPKFNIDKVITAGFDFIESKNQVIALEKATELDFAKRLQEISEDKTIENKYLVIETVGNIKREDLTYLVSNCIEDIKKNNVPILIENGMSGSDILGYGYNDFSETRDIRVIAEYLNGMTKTNLFGIAVNVGYANLLAKSIRFLIEDAADYLKLIHINDNDGKSNQKQLPYTFTRGRGTQTTAWEKIIGALIRVNFEGIMVFDTQGLFNRMPEYVADTMLRLLASIAMFWLHMIYFEELLDTNKKIILFGAGRMVSNYLYVWGDKYKPSFLVDNNENRWGDSHRGYEIKSPDAILNIPEAERLVLICNMHYEEIGLQLRKMGVEYYKYDDNYYDFIPQ